MAPQSNSSGCRNTLHCLTTPSLWNSRREDTWTWTINVPVIQIWSFSFVLNVPTSLGKSCDANPCKGQECKDKGQPEEISISNDTSLCWFNKLNLAPGEIIQPM